VDGDLDVSSLRAPFPRNDGQEHAEVNTVVTAVVFEDYSTVTGTISGVTVTFEKGGQVQKDIAGKSNVTFHTAVVEGDVAGPPSPRSARPNRVLGSIMEASTVTFEGDSSYVEHDVKSSTVIFHGKNGTVGGNVLSYSYVTFNGSHSKVTHFVTRSTVTFHGELSEIGGGVEYLSNVTFKGRECRVAGYVFQSTVLFEGHESSILDFSPDGRFRGVQSSIVTFRGKESEVRATTTILDSLVRFEGTESRVVGNVEDSVVIFTLPEATPLLEATSVDPMADCAASEGLPQAIAVENCDCDSSESYGRLQTAIAVRYSGLTDGSTVEMPGPESDVGGKVSYIGRDDGNTVNIMGPASNIRGDVVGSSTVTFNWNEVPCLWRSRYWRAMGSPRS
jgi:hypothetical protein